MSLLVAAERNTVDGFSAALDRAKAAFDAGESPYQLMADLFEAAHEAVGAGGPGALPALRDVAAEHPVARYVYQCPFTRHSREKPRGYAGDAGLIDYIYGHPDTGPALAASSRVGRSILAHNTESPAAAAVRTRRTIIALKIAEAVERVRRPRILSVACGNARELGLLPDEVRDGIGEFVGFDQDPASLETAARHRVRGAPIRVEEGTIVDLMRSPGLACFDLVYAAGLFDYLSDRLCRRLARSLLARMNPGGRLLLANFVPGIRDAGYMETFMHWSLIYRDRDRILDFVSEIPKEEVRSVHFFLEPNRNIGFVEVVRA